MSASKNPMADERQLNQSDHDLLIELRTEMRGMRVDVTSAADDTKERLILLGANKLEKDTFTTYLQGDLTFKTDHERRVRRLELWGAMAIGGLYVIEILIGWYLLVHYRG